MLKITTRNDKNSIAINSISGYTPNLLKITSRNDKNRNAKNSIAIDIISGFVLELKFEFSLTSCLKNN